jgi:hypothetical protein
LVKFNVEEEAGFLDSLEDLGEIAEDDVLDALESIEAKNLAWDDFVAEHGWLLIDLQGEDTYPGADPLHWFAVVGTSGATYQIAAKGPYGALVICSVAILRHSSGS